MRPNKSQVRQGLILLSLMLLHATVDTYPGMLPVLLPLLRTHFQLSLAQGVQLISVMNLTANVVQILTGHLRARQSKSFFILLGAWLAAALILIPLIPISAAGCWMLTGLMLISGSGVAIVHPEGLRAVHAIQHLPSAFCTSFFLMGGFVGFSGGAWLATVLVDRWGLSGLYGLGLISLFTFLLVWGLRIPLAVEPAESDASSLEPTGPPFRPIFLATIPVAIGSTLLCGFFPTRLNEIGFPLTYGGLAALLFGCGSVIGSLTWALLARRLGELRCAMWAMLGGGPSVLIFLLTLHSRWALIALLLAGATGGSAFALMVSQARHARGHVLGHRMAWMVGGTWGLSSILLMLLGKVAEWTGTQAVLHLTWIAYLTGAIGVWRLRRQPASR
jgi:FSR family fosmidomycin resistance protein-like MFS transporter